MRQRRKLNPLPFLEPQSKSPRDFDREIKRAFGADSLIGIDEAGRGPLAGPVFIAAVLLKKDDFPLSDEIRDSKKVSPKQRKLLSLEIQRRAEKISIAWSYPSEIDKLNILEATLRAMNRAAKKAVQFKAAPVLVDDFNGNSNRVSYPEFRNFFCFILRFCGHFFLPVCCVIKSGRLRRVIVSAA